jgi:DNA invertase Pin-like site-specific DNA recombinase
MSRKPLVRCAIYTRKSSEEGLEQDFNSLDAQREACEAYVRSQAHEGWRALPDLFDDGGFSGGTLERPALLQLMEAVRARRVDVIVIYKIDRLTRSLTDFARLAEQFDAHGVSFVSVTQQFNTTTSMGRLMLNVLLSFAQFEREITGERIRDKIAASKKKGLWMGGTTPFGYDVKDRSLVIKEEEAASLRTIFSLYLELGTVARLEAAVEAQDIRTRRRTLSDGREAGGHSIQRGHLYHLLSNPLYAGRIRHKEKVYDGAHPAIIDQATWDAVQTLLADNTQGPRKRVPRPTTEPGWLTGLLLDQDGKTFALNHANKGGKRYRYYVERPTRDDANRKLKRVPASELERVVQEATCGFLQDPLKLIEKLGIDRPEQTGSIFEAVDSLKHHMADNATAAWDSRIRPTLKHIALNAEGISLSFDRHALQQLLGLPALPKSAPDTLVIDLPVRVKTRGAQFKLVLPATGTDTPRIDITLIKAMARAHTWTRQLITHEQPTIASIAKAEGFTKGYVRRVLRLGLLAPDIVEAILDGRQPVDLTAEKLMLHAEVPRSWQRQRSELLGIS